MNAIELIKEEIKIDEVIDNVKSSDCGALSIFIGTKKGTFHYDQSMMLRYEAHVSVAIESIEIVCTKIRNRWPTVGNIAISHRLGEVGISDINLVVAIASSHYPECLAAVKFAIDELKATAPIWMKEFLKDEQGNWKENKEFRWNSSRTPDTFSIFDTSK